MVTAHPFCWLVAKAAVENFGGGGTANLRMNIKIQEAIEAVIGLEEVIVNPFVRLSVEQLAALPEGSVPNPADIRTVDLNAQMVVYLTKALETMAEKASGSSAKPLIGMLDALAKS